MSTLDLNTKRFTFSYVDDPWKEAGSTRRLHYSGIRDGYRESE
jgi:hypothetical protein